MEDLARLRCASVRFRICGGKKVYGSGGSQRSSREAVNVRIRYAVFDMVSSWKHEKDILHLYVGPKIPAPKFEFSGLKHCFPRIPDSSLRL